MASQRKQDAALARALIEYRTFTTDAASTPRGKDFPRGAVMKRYNAHNAHPFVIFPQKAVEGIAPVASLFTDWKTWFNFDSQNPSLVLAKGDYQIHIRGAVNFQDLKNDDGEGDFIFHKDEIAHKDLSSMGIIARLSLGGHHLAQEHAQKILDFSQPRPGVDKNAPQVETGLHMLGFFVRKNKKVQVVYNGPRPQPDLITATEVYNLVELLNKTAPIFVLLRQTRYVQSDVDANWCNRIRCVVRNGLLPFYNDIARKVINFRFEDWIKNPEKPLAHQPWMRLKTQKPDGSFVEYASHPGKSLFSDTKEWETILSVALIHEIEYENMCSKATFSHTIEHEAQVIHKSGKYIQIAVSVKRHPKVPTPTFPPGSQFSISKGTTLVEKPAAGDDEEMADIDESLLLNRRRWKAKSISKETNRSFVLSFVVDKHEQAEFKNGQVYNVTLEARRNVLPTRRQLNAIALISKGRTDGLKTADIAYNNYLRSFILGKKLPSPPARAPIEDLRPEDRELFDAYVATLRFNPPQQDFYDSVMKSPDNINILQGPPGCGKTFEDASVGASFSIMGKRTGFFCPTNQACEAIMDALIAERIKILSLDATKESKIKYIFFPTTSLFKAQLTSRDEDIEGIVNDIVDDGDTTGNGDYRPYMLWTHIVNHQKIRGADSWQSETERKSSKLWLEILEKIRNGEDVTKKSHRYFIKDAWKLAQSVICDPSIKAIVSTCSNAAVLKEMGFQPDLVIIDESAFGTEADSAVPLSLFADHIILSGDLKQLLPNVKCLHHAEYANQQGLSIFERVLRNGNVPLFRLNINYRIHEEIAILPAALNYGLLDCDPSTAVEEDVFRYFSHFWYSEDGERWRNARQKSPFRSIKETKGIAKKTIRRLFFNTKGSRSAHPDESTSFVNYGNAMAIVEYVCVLLGHWANVDPSKVNFKQLKPSSVTVVTGYAEQKEVIQALLKMALSLIGLSEFPSVVTIDSIQGGQNDVIILDITAANEHHGSLIGFIGKWNRTNVAITRAKKILSIFGNLDSWRSELYNIVEINGRRKFGYLCMDVLDGDVIDTTPVSVERIPATAEELVMDPRNWSIEMPHMDPKESRLKAKGDKIAKIYKTSPEEREKYEKKLWENLQVILKQRDALEKEFKANKEAATDLFQDPVGEAMDIVLEKLGDDEGPIGLEQESEDSEDNPMLAFLEFTSELRGADD